MFYKFFIENIVNNNGNNKDKLYDLYRFVLGFKFFSSLQNKAINRAVKKRRIPSFNIWIGHQVFFKDWRVFAEKLYNHNKFLLNTRYMVYVKLRKGDIYKMVGDHENYKFNGIDDPVFKVFYKTIGDRIQQLLEEYKELKNRFDSVQIVFRVLPYSAE